MFLTWNNSTCQICFKDETTRAPSLFVFKFKCFGFDCDQTFGSGASFVTFITNNFLPFIVWAVTLQHFLFAFYSLFSTFLQNLSLSNIFLPIEAILRVHLLPLVTCSTFAQPCRNGINHDFGDFATLAFWWQAVHKLRE